VAINNGKFDYPAQGWSTGKMRKRGQKPGETEVAMDWQRRGQPESALAEMDKAAGMGIAARGGALPVGAAGVPQAVAGQQATRGVQDQIQAHKDQIQQGLSQVAEGSMNTSGFNKLLKKLGWSRDSGTGEFTDPQGNVHTITSEAQ
jgi:hypothetical protein